MAMIAPIIGLIGTAVSAYGTIAGANAQASAMEYQARVARQKATQEEAVGQRNALETQRKTKLAQSQLQARAAASGAGASDPTVVDLATGIEGRGKYMGGLQQWQGDNRAWDYRTDAVGKEASAQSVRSGGQLSAFGTILGGASSLFKTFSGNFGGSTLPSSATTGTQQPEDNYYWNRPYWMAN
jgi:hypothetical protein